MSKAQRDKGKRGEREVVAIMKDWGFPEARRARQSDGAVDPDVAGCEPLWLEVKRRKSIASCRFMDQSVSDAKEGTLPIVVMREDNGEWIVCVRVADCPAFVAALAERSCES